MQLQIDGANLRAAVRTRRMAKDADFLKNCLLYTSEVVHHAQAADGEAQQEARQLQQRAGDLLGVVAVSYTHLDVYKRQRQRFR